MLTIKTFEKHLLLYSLASLTQVKLVNTELWAAQSIKCKLFNYIGILLSNKQFMLVVAAVKKSFSFSKYMGHWTISITFITIPNLSFG